MKVLTICGSMKFSNEMIAIALELELNNHYAVIQCVYGGTKVDFEKQEGKILAEIHKKKIDLSDAIYIVNIGGYIGASTKKEIAYAKKNNKEIIFHEQ